jgi:hypothetical protein
MVHWDVEIYHQFIYIVERFCHVVFKFKSYLLIYSGRDGYRICDFDIRFLLSPLLFIFLPNGYHITLQSKFVEEFKYQHYLINALKCLLYLKNRQVINRNLIQPPPSYNVQYINIQKKKQTKEKKHII